jgi:hypothetical protein
MHSLTRARARARTHTHTQVDLGAARRVSGVATQGRGLTRDGVYDQWVTAYELLTSLDGSEGSWQRQVPAPAVESRLQRAS